MNRRSVVLLAAVSVASFASVCGAAAAKDTPLKRGASHYYINPPVVNLTLGHGAIPGDTTFLDQEGLANEFHEFLIKSFSEKKIVAETADDADGSVDVELNYTRTFNWGGKALNKPTFRYKVTITKAGDVLASYATSEATTTYGYFKDFPVNAQIGAFKWGVEDEPRDVALIAEIIAREVVKIGK